MFAGAVNFYLCRVSTRCLTKIWGGLQVKNNRCNVYASAFAAMILTYFIHKRGCSWYHPVLNLNLNPWSHYVYYISFYVYSSTIFWALQCCEFRSEKNNNLYISIYTTCTQLLHDLCCMFYQVGRWFKFHMDDLTILPKNISMYSLPFIYYSPLILLHF
jgi:hypothetical protein